MTICTRKYSGSMERGKAQNACPAAQPVDSVDPFVPPPVYDELASAVRPDRNVESRSLENISGLTLTICAPLPSFVWYSDSVFRS